MLDQQAVAARTRRLVEEFGFPAALAKPLERAVSSFQDRIAAILDRP